MQRTTVPYNTLDVFTDTCFSGNQLGLVHLANRSTLTESEKQIIAIEFNYSETVFLYPKSVSDFKVPTYTAQIFCPTCEIPFAGHPTIGTAVHIFEQLETDQDLIEIELKAGRFQIKYDRQLRTAKASIAHQVRLHATSVPWQSIVRSQPRLNDVVGSIADATFPLVSIVPGMTWVLVDLTAQPELMDKLAPTSNDPYTIADLDAGQWQQGFIGSMFYRLCSSGDEPHTEVICVRQRMMGIGIEDPATGSGSCALASYLALTRKESVKLEIEQGVEMGRPSKIFVDVVLADDNVTIDKVELSGQAVEVMSGTMQLPKHS